MSSFSGVLKAKFPLQNNGPYLAIVHGIIRGQNWKETEVYRLYISGITCLDIDVDFSDLNEMSIIKQEYSKPNKEGASVLLSMYFKNLSFEQIRSVLQNIYETGIRRGKEELKEDFKKLLDIG